MTDAFIRLRNRLENTADNDIYNAAKLCFCGVFHLNDAIMTKKQKNFLAKY